tara:strand:+ start:4435 stop:4665 length:231 start_codon:yes stop_codon:yes gene_type:complete
MKLLNHDERGVMNAAGLKESDLWITGDGTSFPANPIGKAFAKKYAKKFTPNLSVNFTKKKEPKTKRVVSADDRGKK